ncbi:excisionase family protein [Marinobacter fonticola]
MTGLTKDQIKIRRRQWVEGRQWKYGPDGVIWYNHAEIDRWVESGWAAT